MADASNLFDLAAKISVDASQSDRVLTSTQQKVVKLTQDFNKAEQAAKKTSQSFKNLGTELSQSLGSIPGASGLANAVSSISSASGGLATAAAGLTVVATAASAAVAGIYALVRSSSEAIGHFKDLSQQVGFSVETLSTLENAAVQSGGSINTVTGALGIFERNMEAAHERGSEMARVFKVLKIDIDDNEKALRQAITTLARMPEGAQQTAIAMKLFGRSGREVLAIAKEMDGELGRFQSELRTTGRLVTTEMAERADQVADKFARMGSQIKVVTFTFASEFYPTASRVLDQFSGLVVDNLGKIRLWVGEINQAAAGAYRLASAVATLGGQITGLGNIPIPRILSILASISGVGNIFRGLQGLGASNQLTSQQQNSILGQLNALRPPSQQYSSLGAARLLSPRIDFGGGGGGGGRGGGGGARTDPGLQLLKQLEEQFKNLTPRTELQRVQDKLLEEQYRSTTDAIKKRVMQTAIEIDEQKKILAITRERYVTEASFARLRDEEFIKSLTRARQLSELQRDRFVTRAGRNRPSWIDLGGGSWVGGPESESTRPRIATVDEQVLRDQLVLFQAQMQGLAANLTSTLRDSIHAGFSQGVEAGIATLLGRLLSMLEEVFFTRLQQGLANALSGVGGGGGGGGFWSNLLGSVIGVFAGAAAGSINLGGGSSYTPGGTGLVRPRVVGRASGGPVAAGMPYWVHKDELIVPAQDGHVFNRQQQAGLGMTVINNWNVQAMDATSFLSRRTQSQIDRRQARAVQRGLQR